MKPFFLTTHAYPIAIIVLIGTVHLQCTGQQPPNPADSTQVQQALVRPPHTYGAYTLKWDRDIGPFYRDTVTIDTVQYFVEEEVPGILVFDAQWPFPGLSFTKLEYYDTLSHALLKTVDLEALSPYYNGQYPGIKFGNFDWDYMILPEEPDSNCVFAKLSPPQYYSTYNDIRLLSDAGHYLVGNYLIGYYRDEGAAVYVVSWESTVIILNPQGEEVLRINPDYSFYAALVTADGRYLCVSYGGRQGDAGDSPFGPCAAYFDLYDMHEDKRLMHYLGMNKLQGILPDRLESFDRFVYQRFIKNKEDLIHFDSEQLIFDPLNREVRIFEIGTEFLPRQDRTILMNQKRHTLRKI
jgi:hypothetical protein